MIRFVCITGVVLVIYRGVDIPWNCPAAFARLLRTRLYAYVLPAIAVIQVQLRANLVVLQQVRRDIYPLKFFLASHRYPLQRKFGTGKLNYPIDNYFQKYRCPIGILRLSKLVRLPLNQLR